MALFDHKIVRAINFLRQIKDDIVLKKYPTPFDPVWQFLVAVLILQKIQDSVLLATLIVDIYGQALVNNLACLSVEKACLNAIACFSCFVSPEKMEIQTENPDE